MKKRIKISFTKRIKINVTNILHVTHSCNLGAGAGSHWG